MAVHISNNIMFWIWKNIGSSRINGPEIDKTQDTDSVMPVYNLIQYNDNYQKASGRL